MHRTTLLVLSKGARKARAIVREDRGHRVVLDEPFFVGTFRETFRWDGRDLPILPFENDKLSIDGRRRLVLKVTDKPYCDGATGFPDKALGIDLAPGYFPHDALYESFDDILADPAWKAAGWTEEALRALADIVLGKMIARTSNADEAAKELDLQRRRSFLSRFCYGAVRRLGGLYHRLAKAFALVLLAGLCAGLAGCAGCMAVPDEGFDPSDEVPVYHVEPIGDQP